jgi:hypothetical protein
MTKVVPSKCTNCGKMLDGATSSDADETSPEPGNITICLYCGELMRYENDLTLGKLTDADMYEIAGDPLVLKMQQLRGLYLEEKKQKKRKQKNERRR